MFFRVLLCYIRLLTFLLTYIKITYLLTDLFIINAGVIRIRTKAAFEVYVAYVRSNPSLRLF